MHGLSKNVVFILFLLLQSTGVFAQAHPVLDGFTAFSDNDKVILRWVIKSGSTCNGIRIYRSADTVSFDEIGAIAGVCGSASEPIPYTFTDSAPFPNRLNYYRLELGGLGFSKFISIEFINFNPGNYLIKPNPVYENAVIYFPNDAHLPLDFMLIDMSGKTVMEKRNITGNFIFFDRQGMANGLYIFRIEHKTIKKITGKIVLK